MGIMPRLLVATTFIAALLIVALVQLRATEFQLWTQDVAAIDAGTSDSAPRTWTVSTAPALRDALSKAHGGDTIVLDAGRTYTGAFELPLHAGDDWVTIRTSATLPERRLTDADIPSLAKVVSTEMGQPAITTARGAHHWRLVGLDVSQTGGNTYGIIRCGEADGYTAVEQVPHHIEIDRVFVHVADDIQERRGIQTNCMDLTIRRSVVRGIKEEGEDSQAIGGWDGARRVRILDNELEAASEPIIFGGSPSSKVTPVPEDIEIRGNHISKPLAWRGKPWNLKNLLELKNARRIVITDNVLENNWLAAQTGWSILFTARGAEGAPWMILEDVTFERNVVRNVSSGINILGLDDAVKVPIIGHRMVIRNNLISTNRKALGGDGWCYQLLGGASDVTIDHNTCINDGTAVMAVDKARHAIVGFRYSNNIALDGEYGIKGSGDAPGTPTIEHFFEKPVVERNVFGDCKGTPYPATNLCLERTPFFAQFVNPGDGDYAVKSTSSWRGAATDRKDIGADVSALPR
jgi:hypothetical protein